MTKTLARSACCALLCTLAACGGSGSSDSSAATNSSTAGTAVVALSAAAYLAAPASNAVVTINRSDGSTGTASVSYTTVNGTATAGQDYVATSGNVTWSDGDTSARFVAVPVMQAAKGKNFNVQLTTVQGSANLGSPAAATIAITATAATATSSGSGVSPSPSGTMIPSAAQILDSSLNVWSITGGAVHENGAAAGYTANVALLLYYGNVIYQENTNCKWWSWSGSAWVSSSNPAPSMTPACSSVVAGSTSNSSGSSGSGFGIAVAGSKFVSTQTGNVVQLLGVSVSGMEQGSTSFANGVENYGNATDPGFAAMASWNMNVVRIPLNEDTWLGVNNCVSDGGSSATLQSNIKQAVANANAAGMYVILDLHWTAPNAFGCPQGQGAMPDADNTIAFWTSVAQTFKGNPAVIFELFNEPFGTNVYANWVEAVNSAAPSGQSASDTSILLNGGTYYNGYMYQCNNGCNLTGGQEYLAPNTTSFQVAGYQAIINAIRATGATNVILANPIGWAGQIQTWLAARPTDPIGQLGVGWHEDGGSTTDAQAVLNAGYPIVITEAYTIGDATFAWATANHVGFSFWAWVDWSGAALSNAKTHTPNAQGTSLKNSYCKQSSVNSLSGC
jgi:endoglucanase